MESVVALETQRLAIRNFTVDDWKDLQEMVLQYGSSEYAAYDHEWPTSDEKVKGTRITTVKDTRPKGVRSCSPTRLRPWAQMLLSPGRLP